MMFGWSLWICCAWLLLFLASGKSVNKEFKTLVDYLDEALYDNSNDVLIYGHPIHLKTFPSSRIKQQPLSAQLPSATTSESSSKCLPRPRKRRTSLDPDSYHIGDIGFSIPTRTKDGILKRSVLAECGFINGLSAFKPMDVSERYSESDSENPIPVELLFRWNNLRARCQVSTVLDGLMDGTGDAVVLVKPLYMRVHVPSRQDLEGWPKVEMSMARDVTVTMEDVRDLGDDVRSETVEAIKVGIESQFLCIVNSEVINALKDSMVRRYRKDPMLY